MAMEVATHSIARPGGPRLALCVVAALALHAALLLQARPTVARFAPIQAMSIRNLNSMSPPKRADALTPLATSQSQRTAPLESLPLAALLTLPAAQNLHADAPAPHLVSPDAGLPSARALATVSMSVETDGYVSSVVVEPNALPAAFERAIQRAFEGSMLSPEQRGGLRAAGRLCIQVEFREGEAPDWQRLAAPVGICAV
jgi:hypothetical protein